MDEVIEDMAVLRSSTQRRLNWYQAGHLHVVIGRHFQLSQPAKAYRLLEGRTSVGKIVFVPEGGE